MKIKNLCTVMVCAACIFTLIDLEETVAMQRSGRLGRNSERNRQNKKRKQLAINEEQFLAKLERDNILAREDVAIHRGVLEILSKSEQLLKARMQAKRDAPGGNTLAQASTLITEYQKQTAGIAKMRESATRGLKRAKELLARNHLRKKAFMRLRAVKVV